jgi:hypothetical protein
VSNPFALWRVCKRGAATLLVCGALATVPSCGITDDERFQRSVESMEKVARTAGPSDPTNETPHEIGLLVFEDVFQDGDRVYFKLGDDTAGTDPYGYVWSPKSPPTDDPDDAAASSYEHMQGPWYRWSDSY